MILWVFIEFFGVKMVITDIYRYLFKNSSTSARALQLRFFDGKIGDFTDFSSTFSSMLVENRLFCPWF